MPYKRKARVLFLSVGDEAEYASACARRLGGDWVDTRITRPGNGDDAVDTAWADLFVTIGQEPDRLSCALSPTTRHVHWPDCGRDEIARRVNGMIGGMRMLARLDPVDTA